jgi:nucleoside-diphosphate-sugar epimerase
MAMKVLVTGCDGYIGSVLAPYLSDRGYAVTGLDTGYYLAGLLYHDGKNRPRTLVRDTRQVTADDLRGFDAVVHLAELSNDPLGHHNRETTYDINYRGSMNVARAAKRAGVNRFVYASSCSVYGIGSDDTKTEVSLPDPQTPYAECKLRCEEGLIELCEDAFVTTCMRNATAFGASPRMRFDTVLNNLAGLAWTTRAITMTSDGTPWRPLVHVLDICQSIDVALRASVDRVAGEIFNVGDDQQNYRVREIAAVVAATFPGCALRFGQADADQRSYRVSFAKIRERLPQFQCHWTAQYGADQLRALFSSVSMNSETFNAAPFTRLQGLKALIATGQLDERFFWKSPCLDSIAGIDASEAAQ